jgi:hypothetical protein
MRAVTKWFKGFLCAMAMLGGFVVYRIRGKTPTFAYHGMVRLFCLSRGRSNDWLSRLIGIFAPPYSLPQANGVLGDMSDTGALHAAAVALRTRGYYQFPNLLPDDVCDRLVKYATSHLCDTRQMDGHASRKLRDVIYDRSNPMAVHYEFRARDLFENPDIQRLLTDSSLVAVAQEYLGARPVIDALSMWWVTAFSDRPDSNAAQLFHFDMDRPKWLKFFIYLTDVTPVNGPHTFVSGSHRSGMIPERLLSKGYARLSDEEVLGMFAKEDILEFCGARGSIIAEDTRGLHKGRHVEKGDRLMLQIQFSNSLFGANYPRECIGESLSPDLSEAVRRFPALYAAYVK